MITQKPIANIGTGDFGQALWDPDSDTPAGLVGPDGKTAPKRFNVYRNNVIVSLVEALERTFPAVGNLLGEDYFKALARAYVLKEPPNSPVLIWYGGGFADFIEAFPPLEAYPYLADVARLEWAWLQAFHAGDAHALDPVALGEVEPDRLGSVRFVFHPAASVINSRWPVWDLVRANRFEPDAELEIDLQLSQSVLVTRPELDVELLLLRPGGAVFLTSLADGKPLAEAAEDALSSVSEFSLSECLSDLLSNGVFTDLQVS
ncbi:MAG: DNA-binding domain-containing protein [Roseibium sp.]|uniref:HvfC/BufC N-terminal domain-containing protein n=1 Tax=Roseibium sp. TaxID=1936156 RepID=UPI00260B2234|nr:DNA-binding domain-containing protein [Roseibium sp.]MCV0425816.1 DNA-binding domain-containing protein [Roseibium sp.]